MKSLVVDTSVAVKWFFEEEYFETARAILKPENTLIAPDLMFIEISSVLWKRVRSGLITPEDAHIILKTLLKMPIVFYSSIELSDFGMEIAIKIDRSVYDSLYIALAQAQNATVITADEKFYNALQNSQFAELISCIH